MTLLSFKWIAAGFIFAISLIAGFASLRFATKYQKQLQLGDAAANGIFVGAAIFHLFPSAIAQFHQLNITTEFLSAYFYVLLIIGVSFLFLVGIDFIFNKIRPVENKIINAWLLTITLSIHAFIGGMALGISETVTIASVIFIAILVHKGFEMFAFVVILYRQLHTYRHVLLIFLIFTLITPLGIWLGIISDTYFQANIDNILTACFNAFAAGTFLYIGLIDRHHQHYHPALDSYHQYSRVLAAIAGVVMMAILSIWI